MIQAHRDEEHNRLRKSLAVSFSDKSMKEMEPRVKGWVQLLQTKLAERGGAEVDMVELFRCAVSLTIFQIFGGKLGGELGMPCLVLIN
jgi:cytochrome P450